MISFFFSFHSTSGMMKLVSVIMMIMIDGAVDYDVCYEDGGDGSDNDDYNYIY